MEKLYARYGLRKGGSGMRTINSAQEAEKILKGGYGVTTVKLECNGELIGARSQLDDGKWWWFYDDDFFRNNR